MELEFYDVKSKKKFKSTNYRIVEKEGKGGRMGYFAVTKAPSGDYECWKIISKDAAAKLKK